MQVIICRVDQDPISLEIKDDLHTLQELVGGFIEMLPLTGNLVLICNEEGKLKGLKPNYIYCNRFGDPKDIIVGDFLICRIGKDGEMESSRGWYDWHLLTVEKRILRKYERNEVVQ